MRACPPFTAGGKETFGPDFVPNADNLDPVLRRQTLLAGLVLARVTCPLTCTGATKSERKSCLRSVENLVSHWNGCLRAKTFQRF